MFRVGYTSVADVSVMCEWVFDRFKVRISFLWFPFPPLRLHMVRPWWPNVIPLSTRGLHEGAEPMQLKVWRSDSGDDPLACELRRVVAFLFTRKRLDLHRVM